jgi:hypothetical protein
MNNTITHEILQDSISYEAYINLTKEIVKSTNPPEMYRDDKMMRYTTDNLERMLQLNDTIEIQSKLYNELQQSTAKWIWVCITEPWCGDASQIVPILHLISTSSDRVEFKILLRDNHNNVMDNYLTNGGRSIPKLICLKADDLIEVGTWGPRPAILQEIVVDKLNDPSLSFGDKVRMVHSWYGENKGEAIQHEFIDLVHQWRNI